ncbi:hypothetical protein MJO28_000954 [Puccinia striiformis f. sp. tritici]|uniref:Uncharacterized protein n=1 Tax=Puccinia striiformis f. sp. tritici TaxID=168172 RepID=A0ACC0F0Z6_9BASI|nr:hypothetical protein MJO28_000954 [Puccinia striiformis f. sp. tritici]
MTQGILDDAKSKAKELQIKSKEGIDNAKAQINTEVDALKSKVTSATGINSSSFLDDAKSKAKELENISKESFDSVKTQISSEANALRNKLTSATGISATGQFLSIPYRYPSPSERSTSLLGEYLRTALNLYSDSDKKFYVTLHLDIFDEAKSKARQLENKSKEGIENAKSQISSEVDTLRSQVASIAGIGAGPSRASPELYSTKYYTACVSAGVVACGLTHALVTPLDLVKCRRQVDKTLYKSNFDGWSKIYKSGGLKGLYTGVGPTWLGYSIQGGCKYGFYEFFKKKYADAVGPVNAVKYKDAIYLAGSASAELIADTAFLPMEAVKVRMQTTIPPFATGTVDGFKKFVAVEGTGGLYKSLGSLWSRQIPYTMMKFWSFEATVTKIYASLGKPKDSYNKLQQLGVSFVGGYFAGIFCAVVSHPADTMVSKLNAVGKKGSTKPTVGTIYKEIGFGGLWAGLGTRIVMVGTLTALQWLIYDYVKVAFGFPTTGSVEPEPPKK